MGREDVSLTTHLPTLPAIISGFVNYMYLALHASAAGVWLLHSKKNLLTSENRMVIFELFIFDEEFEYGSWELLIQSLLVISMIWLA